MDVLLKKEYNQAQKREKKQDILFKKKLIRGGDKVQKSTIRNYIYFWFNMNFKYIDVL